MLLNVSHLQMLSLVSANKLDAEVLKKKFSDVSLPYSVDYNKKSQANLQCRHKFADSLNTYF